MTEFPLAYRHGVILALDEIGLYFQAALTLVGEPVAQTPIVAVHPQRDQFHFHGAMNLCDDRETALAAIETSSEMTTQFVMLFLM